jgi:hypothetical protein
MTSSKRKEMHMARRTWATEVKDVQIVMDLISERKARLTGFEQWEARAELAYVLGSLTALMRWAKQREETA